VQAVFDKLDGDASADAAFATRVATLISSYRRT